MQNGRHQRTGGSVAVFGPRIIYHTNYKSGYKKGNPIKPNYHVQTRILTRRVLLRFVVISMPLSF